MTNKLLNWTSPTFAQSIENAKRCFYIQRTENRQGWIIYTNDLDADEFDNNWHDSRRDAQDFAEAEEIKLIAQDAQDLAETMTDEDRLMKLSDFKDLPIGTVLVVGWGLALKANIESDPIEAYTKIVLREQPQFEEVDGPDDEPDDAYTLITLNEFVICATCYGTIEAEIYKVSKGTPCLCKLL